MPTTSPSQQACSLMRGTLYAPLNKSSVFTWKLSSSEVHSALYLPPVFTWNPLPLNPTVPCIYLLSLCGTLFLWSPQCPVFTACLYVEPSYCEAHSALCLPPEEQGRMHSAPWELVLPFCVIFHFSPGIKGQIFVCHGKVVLPKAVIIYLFNGCLKTQETASNNSTSQALSIKILVISQNLERNTPEYGLNMSYSKKN